MLRHLVYLTYIIFVAGCVSINLPNGSGKPSKSIQLVEPNEPFKSLKIANSDRAWQSKKTGNTISFSSECEMKSTPSLASLEADYLSAVTDVKIKDTQKLTFNSREARKTTANGTIEGVAITVRTLIFIKNDCQYVLSYTGLEKTWSEELSFFDEFVTNFRTN